MMMTVTMITMIVVEAVAEGVMELEVAAVTARVEVGISEYPWPVPQSRPQPRCKLVSVRN